MSDDSEMRHSNCNSSTSLNGNERLFTMLALVRMLYKHNGIFGRANNLNNYIMSEAVEIFSSQLAKINRVSSSGHFQI